MQSTRRLHASALGYNGTFRNGIICLFILHVLLHEGPYLVVSPELSKGQTGS